MADEGITVVEESRLIKAVEETQKYAFLIGAGTSKPEPAGIPTSKELIDRWKSECYDIDSTDMSFDNWVAMKNEEIGESQSEYGFWFEERHPTRGQRREFIKELVEDSDPGLGHVVMSTLMAKGYVPHVLTTNFDDLLFDAFYLYLEDRPNLVDHRAVAPEFKLTGNIPSIIKLHGDYLYDDLKNTKDETSTLDEAMKDVLDQSLNEYGLVVIGYGGSDTSIMEPLKETQISEYGLFWCGRDSDRLSDDAEDLLERNNTYFVEYDGFESLMANFSTSIDDVNLPNPRDIVDRAMDRANRLEESISDSFGIDDPEVILEDASPKLYHHLTHFNSGDYDKAVDMLEGEDFQAEEEKMYYFRARSKRHAGDLEGAEEDYRKVMKLDKGFHGALNDLAIINCIKGEYEEADRLYDRALEVGPDEYPTALTNKAVLRIRQGEFEEAFEYFEQALEDDKWHENTYLNRGILSIMVGDIDGAIEDAVQLKTISDSVDNRAAASLLIIISKILKGADITDEKAEYNALCEREFNTTSRLHLIQDWVEIAELPEDKYNEIRELMNMYAKHVKTHEYGRKVDDMIPKIQDERVMHQFNE